MKLAEKERSFQRGRNGDGDGITMFILWIMPILFAVYQYTVNWNSVEVQSLKTIGFALLCIFPVVSFFMMYIPYQMMIHKRSGKKLFVRQEREINRRQFSVYLIIPSLFSILFVMFFIFGPILSELMIHANESGTAIL